MSETRTLITSLMLYETRALQQAYAAQTGLRLSLAGVLHVRVFLKTTLLISPM